MKNLFWLSAILVVCSLTIGCKKADNANCSKNVSIAAVQPNTNPVGYEVLIKTSGFTSAAKVVFGSVTATSRAGGQAGELIAKVPAGLSGNVEITVEEGDCTARSGGFVVSGALPSGAQPSLPNIIVPTTPTTPPTGIGNFYTNAATTFDANGNAEQTMVIVEREKVGDVITIEDEFSKEFNKSVESPVSGFANLATLKIEIVINRAANGGSLEHFDGQFIAVPDFLPANATGAFLLVSRETGRQLLMYKL